MKNLQIFNSEILKKGKVSLGALSLAAVMFVSLAGCGSEETKVTSTPAPSSIVTETPVPTSTPTPTSTPIVTPAPTPTPEVKFELSAGTFDEAVSNIMARNSEKGLDTIEALVRSSLLIVNLDELTDEDLIKLGIADLNMQKELQNLLTYVSEVETHNLTASKENYISLADLSFGDTDKEMLNALEGQYFNLKDELAKKVEEPNLEGLSEEEVETAKNTYSEEVEKLEEEKSTYVVESVAGITDFVIGTGKVDTTIGSFTRRNLSSGAGILSESYIQSIGEVAYGSGYNSKAIKANIKTIDSLTIGLNYINDIYSSSRIASCVEKANNNQYTK